MRGITDRKDSSPSLRRRGLASVLQGNTVELGLRFLHISSRRRGCLCLRRAPQVLWREDLKHWLLSMHLLDATPAVGTWAPLRHRNLTEGKWGFFPKLSSKMGDSTTPTKVRWSQSSCSLGETSSYFMVDETNLLRLLRGLGFLNEFLLF